MAYLRHFFSNEGASVLGRASPRARAAGGRQANDNERVCMVN